MGNLVLHAGVIALLAASAALAQRTWIVDAAGGGDFKTVSAAFLAAADGDTVRVRQGYYPETVTTSKGIFLLGEGRPSIDWLQIQNLAATKTFVIKGIQSQLGSGVELFGNQGSVHLEDVMVRNSQYTLFPRPALTVRQCRLVTVTGGSLEGYLGVWVSGSTVYFVNTPLSGTAALVNFMISRPAQPALNLTGGRVILAGCACAGGAGSMTNNTPNAPSPAVHMSAGTLTVTGNTATTIRAGSVPPQNPLAASAIVASGTLHIDTRVRLFSTNTTTKVKGVTPTWGTFPALVASGGAPGTRVRTELFAPPGWTTGLLVGLPGRPYPLPPLGEVWLDLTRIVILLDVGKVGSSGSHVVRVPFPWSLPRGIPVAFQSLTLSPHPAFVLSTPVTVVLD